MVDTIEIKLDEMDAKIDQIAYAPKYKAAYEIDEMLKSRTSGGFIDTIIKGVTGGGRFAGALAAGGAAGGALILADVIKDATKQSKILGNVTENVQKSLGLLIDLVLLPFLPLIYGAMIQLYAGIIGFGGWWKDVWETLKKEGLIGLVKLGLQWSLDTLADWQKSLTEWLFSDKPLKDKIAEFTLGVLDFLNNIEFLPGISLAKLISWLFGEDSAKEFPKLMFDLAVGLFDTGLKVVGKVLEFLFGEGSILHPIIDFTINLIKSGADWIWNLLESIYGAGKSVVEAVTAPKINLPVGGGAGGVSSTSTTNQSGTNEFNFFGLQPEGLSQEIAKALLQFGAAWFK